MRSTPEPRVTGGPASQARDAGAVLSAQQVSKRFITQQGKEVRALENVNFDCAHGEFLTLAGPSGCGKSTMLKLSAGLVRPSDGVISYRGTGAPVPPGTYGMVFQSPTLLPWRTIMDNVRLTGQVLGTLRGEPARQRAVELLELVGLAGTEDQYPNELSGGMQQRAAIARALFSDPDVLFMDEPFGALDAMTRETLNAELQRIHMDRGTTVVFVTHSITEAVFLSDRVLVMSAGPGRVVADLAIPLRRPREMADLLSEEFRRLEHEVRSTLESE